MMTRHRLILLFFILLATGMRAMAQDVPDTLEIGGATIIRDNDTLPHTLPKKGIFKQLDTRINTGKNIRTAFLNMDIGYNNFQDRTVYAGSAMQAFAPGSSKGWFALNAGRSHHFNLWLVTQNVNLVQHIINLEYAAGIAFNNYRFQQPLQFLKQAAAKPVVVMDPLALATPPARIYKKNKLAAHYLTVPLLLNFNLSPHRLYNFEVSAGVSAGYLFAARNKSITSDGGKARIKDDFELRPWQISYVANVTLGIISLYGSYAAKSMFKYGADFLPYSAGLRIKPMNLFARLQQR